MGDDWTVLMIAIATIDDAQVREGAEQALQRLDADMQLQMEMRQKAVERVRELQPDGGCGCGTCEALRSRS